MRLASIAAGLTRCTLVLHFVSFVSCAMDLVCPVHMEDNHYHDHGEDTRLLAQVIVQDGQFYLVQYKSESDVT